MQRARSTALPMGGETDSLASGGIGFLLNQQNPCLELQLSQPNHLLKRAKQIAQRITPLNRIAPVYIYIRHSSVSDTAGGGEASAAFDPASPAAPTAASTESTDSVSTRIRRIMQKRTSLGIGDGRSLVYVRKE